MRANELRIGNFVKSKDGVTVVDLIKEDGIGIGYDFDAKYSWEEIKPIPLTEEILLKAGFDEESEKPINYSANLYVDMVSNEACVGCEYDGFHLVRSNIKYVHQLQNLYFALTGEELNIEL